MRKFILCTLVALIGNFSINAQGLLNIGAGGGIPVGDAGDLTTFAIAVDLGYLFDLSDDFQAGATTGYHHYFGDEITSGSFTVDIDDIQFLPIAASGRFNASDQIYLQGDIGYALELGEGGDGGLYYRPTFGYNISEQAAIDLSYSAVSNDGNTFSSVLLRFQWQLAL